MLYTVKQLYREG